MADSSWFRSGTEFRIQPLIGGLLPMELRSVVPPNLATSPLLYVTSASMYVEEKDALSWSHQDNARLQSTKSHFRRPAFQSKLPVLNPEDQANTPC